MSESIQIPVASLKAYQEAKIALLECIDELPYLKDLTLSLMFALTSEEVGPNASPIYALGRVIHEQLGEMQQSLDLVLNTLPPVRECPGGQELFENTVKSWKTGQQCRDNPDTMTSGRSETIAEILKR